MVQTSSTEVTFSKDELIITKTDTQGKIVYANRTFMRVADYSEVDLLGQNHNIIRHPDMPKGVFYGLWKALKSGEEFFGFVKNKTAHGGYYWVFANITPDYSHEKLVGYYSVRRTAPVKAREVIENIYKKMNHLESQLDKASAAELSWQAMLNDVETDYQLNYDEFVMQLYQQNVKG